MTILHYKFYTTKKRCRINLKRLKGARLGIKRTAMMDEEWRTITLNGIETNYEVSNMGQVRNKTTQRLLKLTDHPQGYKRANMWVDRKLKSVVVHRLVATAFIPNPDGAEQVNHKDYDTSNNCADNLEWMSRSENVLHSYKRKDRKVGKRSNDDHERGEPIPGYEGYLATEDGHIYSTKTNRLLSEDVSRDYAVVALRVNGQEQKCRVHRLMALTYLVNPDNKENVNHIDGDKLYNHYTNLEWITHAENVQHAVESGLKPTRGGVEQYDTKGELLMTHSSLNAAAEYIGISKAAISRCCLGKQHTCKGFLWRYKN